MSKYVLEIDDDKLLGYVNGIVDTVCKEQLRYKCSDIDEMIALMTKEVVYSHKEEIIERVVERATKEIVKKGIPKLLERV
jgi:hypothetical protein